MNTSEERFRFLQRDAGDAAARIRGADSPPYLQVRRAYADALAAAGKTELAEQQFIALMEAIKSKFSVDNPQIIIPMNNLALLRIDTGRAKNAEPLLRSAVDLATKTHNASGPLLHRNLGYCLTKLGRFDEAETELLASFEMLKSSPNPHANDRSAERLVELHTAWNKPESTKKWRSTTQR